MAQIDWEEFKEFKKHTVKEDRFDILIDFIKSYYNISHPRDMYGMLKDDDIGNMLLERKEIKNAEGLENYIFQS